MDDREQRWLGAGQKICGARPGHLAGTSILAGLGKIRCLWLLFFFLILLTNFTPHPIHDA
jgi:hypothetical protein